MFFVLATKTSLAYPENTEYAADRFFSGKTFMVKYNTPEKHKNRIHKMDRCCKSGRQIIVWTPQKIRSQAISLSTEKQFSEFPAVNPEILMEPDHIKDPEGQRRYQHPEKR